MKAPPAEMACPQARDVTRGFAHADATAGEATGARDQQAYLGPPGPERLRANRVRRSKQLIVTGIQEGR